MGAAQPRLSNFGILYFANGIGSPTYVDIAGVTQQIGTLTGSYTEQTTVPLGAVDYSKPFVGAPSAISMFVDIGLLSATSIKMKLQGRYDPSLPWTDIQTVRQDTGVTAAEQIFAAAGTYLVQTASILAVPQIRVIASGVSIPGYGLGDFIKVSAWVQ